MTVKITELPTIDVLVAADFIPVVDASSGVTKKATGQLVVDLVAEPLDSTFRVIGSSDATKKLAFEVDGLTTVTTRTMTIPDRNITLGTILGTLQATTSGTAFDFTIPAGVRHITVSFLGVSLSGTDQLLVQLGDVDGVEVTTYISSGSLLNNGATVSTFSSTTGFIIGTNATGHITSGTMTLILHESSTNTWVSSHSAKTTTAICLVGGGEKALSASLTTVRLTRTGTDTFDAGSVNVLYSY